MPGVPPDAVDNVKKLFKGLFKRGKNKKQDTSAAQTIQTGAVAQQQSASQSQAPASQPPAAIQQHTGATANTNKPLPATHPLATGEHSEPQEAVPVNHAARPSPPAGANDATTRLESQGVSPASITAASGSAPVTAVEKDAAPAVPAKDAGNTDSSSAAPGISTERRDMGRQLTHLQ
ncbi:hypothetical protein DOTSEDRAFT_39763 [Dothistroma septosporum NZE10]|uniref:Uncharacterized protein n=1 Tax=Dothistroma septosporum (strain NZE10 / CBS 128990) TaxID=675120 RepID=N1PXY3_DOTSN|nr:hypothetical protein DOTSEDRAFT_39763 [Dothistroma septosporum NZE10]